MLYAKWKWELPLNKDDKKWIDSAIGRAVQRSARTENPANDTALHGPAAWTRDHKLAAGILAVSIIGVIVAYFAWWQPQQTAHEEQDFGLRVDHRIDGKLDQPIKDIHQTQIDVAKIRCKLDKLDHLSPLVEQKLKALGSDPSRKDNQNATKELLAQSRANELPQIPSTAIKMAGKSFVAASPNNTGAWDVASIWFDTALP